jgi:hypothetical protein
MKRGIGLILGLAVLAAFASGCASTYPVGSAWADLKVPVNVVATGPIPETNKVGVATCKSFFGVYASGDASLETAMKNGKITKVHYMDWEVKNILGIAKYRLVVHGE